MSSTKIFTLLESIVTSIRYTNAITSIVKVGNVYTVYTNNTYNLIAGHYVTINSIQYKILSVTTNSFFVVTSTSNVSGSSWTACAPFFFYGNAKEVNQQLDKINKDYLKYPAVCVFYPQTFNNYDSYSIFDYSCIIDFFIINPANVSDWNSDDYIVNIEVLKIISGLIKTKIDLNQYVIHSGNFNVNEYPIWNLVASGQDSKVFEPNASKLNISKNVFSGFHSCVNLKVDLKILKNINSD